MLDIAPGDVGILVPGLLHDEGEVRPAARRRGGKIAAQRVTGEFAGIQADAQDGPLDYLGDGVSREPPRDSPVIDSSEDGTLDDAALAQPVVERPAFAPGMALPAPNRSSQLVSR